MNYDRIIIELLDRVSRLEERISELEKTINVNNNTVGLLVKDDALKTRDKTKYLFEGRICLKNRLVYEVVKKFILDNPNISFNELNDVFYDKLQGSFGVVRIKSTIDEQKKIRYFYKDEDTLKLADETLVVVSNQWGKENIKPFIVLAKSLGYEIKEA